MFYIFDINILMNISPGLEQSKIRGTDPDDDAEITDCRTECLWEYLRRNFTDEDKFDLFTKIMNMQLDACEVSVLSTTQRCTIDS